MRGTLVSFVVLLAVPLLTGCGETCQSTCDHVYASSECGIHIPGATTDKVIGDCVRSCERALSTPGDMGTYDPHARNPGVKIELETDQQAAAWIDCVWEIAPEPGYQDTCKQLDPAIGGKCAPIPP